MKTKKINSKLVLKKETVADMGNYELNNVRGGGTGISGCICPTVNNPLCQPTAPCSAICVTDEVWC